MNRSNITACGAVALLLFGFAGTGRAQGAATPASFVTVTGTAAFLTDYRFRGLSLSNKDVVAQASLTATTTPGFFVGIWGSSIEPIGGYVRGDGSVSSGSHQEIDLSGGWSKSFGALTPTIGAIGYVYPGGRGVNFYEVYGSVGIATGPISTTVGINYAPGQDNLFRDNVYIYVAPAFGIPNTPVTIRGSVGYEDGAFQGGTKTKIDYMIGADFKYKFLTFTAQYVGNDLGRRAFDYNSAVRNSKDGFVFGVTAAF